MRTLPAAGLLGAVLVSFSALAPGWPERSAPHTQRAGSLLEAEGTDQAMWTGARDAAKQVRAGQGVRREDGKGVSVAAASPGDRTCPVGSAYLPAGTFVMGDRGDEVSVAELCLDLTEVTVEAYSDCYYQGECSAALTGSDCNSGVSGRRNHPINCVDWNQADTYCRAQGKRLPTEEEWEWAARSGPEGRSYPWGSEEPGAQVCWDGAGNDEGRLKRTSTCAVGVHPEGDSAQGVHDLAGNVWEWTSGKQWAAQVFRGGCWSLTVGEPMRAAYRGWGDSSYRFFFLGFRCARSP